MNFRPKQIKAAIEHRYGSKAKLVSREVPNTGGLTGHYIEDENGTVLAGPYRETDTLVLAALSQPSGAK